MGFPRHILRLLAVATALLLASCIDGREEFWLNADGSGRADVTYSLPAVAARFQGGESGVRKLVTDFLAATPGLTAPDCEVTTDQDRLVIRVRVAFASALELKAISKNGSLNQLPSSASHLAGDFKVSLACRTLDFSRTIAPGEALPGVSFLPASQFEGRKLVVNVARPMTERAPRAGGYR